MFLQVLGYSVITVVLAGVGYVFLKILVGGLDALTKDND